MKKKTIIPSKHKYHLLNPYYGGAQAILYNEEAVKFLAAEANLLSSHSEILHLILSNPIRPN